MSRRPPSDAFTRFTSTSPHASSKPPSSSSPVSSFSYQPPTPQQHPISAPTVSETAAEKVARLRAAAHLRKAAATQLTGTDRLIASGRRWADVAHRGTTYGLILLTGASTVIALYGLTSLVAHNRRQKRAWIDRELDRLGEAQQAFLRGEADAEQLHLLEMERAGEEMKEGRRRETERKKTEGVWAKMKGVVGMGAAAGEMGVEEPGEAERRFRRGGVGRERILEEAWVEGEVKPQSSVVAVSAVVKESGIKGVGLDEKGRPVPAGKMQRVVREVQDERRTGEKEVTARTGITGGPLDVLAGNVASAVTEPTADSRGWFRWLGGSKS